MHISSNFDGGNIEVVSAESPDDIRLRINRDNNSEFYQWFYFRLSGVQGRQCKLSLINAGGAAYPKGFVNYQVLYSYDRQEWRRHATRLEGDSLRFDFEADYDTVFFAYFVPYSMERHLDLIATAIQSPLCSHQVLGQSLDGQDIDMLTFSSPDARSSSHCWIIARQHPGETMAQWWMEGFIERLMNEQDVGAQCLLGVSTIHLIPNMNPDGSRRGHLRTNAAGKNLNRNGNLPAWI